MIDFRYNESKQRGTQDFPLDYYVINTSLPHYYLPLHWHVEHEIIHVLQGTYCFFVDGKEYEFSDDSYICIQNGVLHGDGKKSSKCAYESVVYDLDLIRSRGYASDEFLKQVEHHQVMIDPPLLGATQNSFYPDLCVALKTLFESAKKMGTGDKRNSSLFQGTNADYLAVCGALQLFYGSLYRNKIYIECNEENNTHKRTDQLKAVINLIENSFDKSISLDDMASVAGMSPKYFCRVFKQMTHSTPVEYLNQYRVEQACLLLENPNLQIIDIAFSCGFNDFSYFIKTFKRFKHITPLNYRKLLTKTV